MDISTRRDIGRRAGRGPRIHPNAGSIAFGANTAVELLVGDGGDAQMAVRVLVVADDTEAIAARLRELQRRGYTARGVGTGAAAIESHPRADLVVLDLDLPDIDGLEVCRSIREVSDTPIISVAARDTELDRVLALQAGADDCVVSSCGEREMLARIEALLRRAYPAAEPARNLAVGALEIDGGRHEVRLDGVAVKLTTKEFELLHTLAESPDTVISRKELMVRVWDTTWSASTRTIDTHVRAVRAKLGSNSWIITVRGIGYRMGHGPGAARLRPRAELSGSTTVEAIMSTWTSPDDVVDRPWSAVRAPGRFSA
ncbi:response regulator transcription factor [Nocardia bovistercoris]|uniref:Response regulator transcription factor n=1 Tax=Nocardia bovistercoris TaxID=2785916 RepID=A0A931N678_9NOCA|nr:response regulator transcription factor [Nocardia bovistercoris]